jgi:hypothetical protein
MVTGFVIAGIYAATRRPNQKLLQFAGLGIVWVVIVLLTQFRVGLWL